MKRVLLLTSSVLVGCAAAAVNGAPPAPVVKSKRVDTVVASANERGPRLRAPAVELFFKGDQAWARRACPGDACEEWPIGDVRKDEMVFSPDGLKFAYVREKATASNARAAQPAHVLVRNLAGDPINDFPVYRPGRPDELIWIDNRRLGYVAPHDPKASAKNPPSLYVVHDVSTGEVLSARSGAELVWGPRRQHVAFVSGAPQKQAVVVDGRNVWPRYGTTKVHGPPVWSPDGHGLAFTEETPQGPRLVVLVEFDDAQGDLTWNVPREALAPGLKVFWAGDSKVVIGETSLKPRFAADWQRLH
jgi:hypothetical protein